MKFLAANWVGDLLNTAMELWNKYIAKAFDLLLTDPKTDSAWSGVSAVVGYWAMILKGVGIGLLTLCFLYGLSKQFVSYQDLRRPEQIMPLFLRVSLALVLTVKGLDLLWGIVAAGQGLAAGFVGDFQIGENLLMEWPAVMMDTVEKDVSFFERIPLLVAALIAVIGFFLMAVSILLTIYGRFFEMFMHMAFAPVFLPTFASQSTERIGVSYLKSFLGVSLRAAVVAVAFVIFIKLWEGADAATSSSGASLVWEMLAHRFFWMLLLRTTVKATDQIVVRMIGS